MILSDSTGSTQGMRLRISPPANATARIAASVLHIGVSAAPGTTASVCSTASSPSTSVSVSATPASASPARPRGAAMRNTACRAPARSSSSGAATYSVSGPSTNRSGRVNPAGARAVTRKRRSAPAPETSTASIAGPPGRGGPGTRARNSAIGSANVVGDAGPAGRSSARLA